MTYQPVAAVTDFGSYIQPLVETWIAECKPDLDAHRTGYKKLHFDTLFERLALGQEPDGKHVASHQRRLKTDSRRQFLVALSGHKAVIRDAECFEDLNRTIREIANGVDGIGHLMVYDTTLRFGFHHAQLPKEVHLQQGAFHGARRFFERSGKAMYFRAGSSLPPHAFAPLDEHLKPYEIENFLCTMKAVLEGVKSPNHCSAHKFAPSQC